MSVFHRLQFRGLFVLWTGMEVGIFMVPQLPGLVRADNFSVLVLFFIMVFWIYKCSILFAFKMYFVIFSGSEVTMPDIRIWEIWVTFWRYQEIISTNPLEKRVSGKDAKLISSVNILMNVVYRFTSLSQVHAEITWI